MMIKEFFSEELALSEGDYKKFSIGDLTSSLNGRVDKRIISTLDLIKDFGDKASHYNPDVKLSRSESEKAVQAAFELFPLIIIDHLISNPLSSHPDRATLLSTTLPKIRIKIIEEFIDFNNLDSEYQIGLLHKWCLACVKNGGREKARRKLHGLLKKGKISESFFDFETKSINEIAFRMSKGELPVPKSHEDFARNFNDVLSKLSPESKSINEKLISILERMVEKIQPSEFGTLRGMQVFMV
ncbi:hypothetical protein [Pseudomonas oryziphila]|uniref:DUF4145 domain-containing protein n=1 Tax=Pseudomonas oryziphila TaxID=2894079 RepID=A0ABM7CLP0_9PSED|nr:hypothetical protein [Pseudomonas oryziphila]AZL72314.1 hypothetical protein EI693_04105 [Pseudomonas oryziphila]